MASIIPSLNDCRHISITNGEKQVAKILQLRLRRSTKVWFNPQIPPQNLEPDFLVLDPGRGLLIIEVKDWKIETIKQADNNTVTLIVDEQSKVYCNPYKQAKKYAYATKNVLEAIPSFVYPRGHKREGQLILPYGVIIVLTNITRAELKNNNLEIVFGSQSVFCKDEIFLNTDVEIFRDKLWSILPFSLKKRLESHQIKSFYQKLGLPSRNKSNLATKNLVDTTELPSSQIVEYSPENSNSIFTPPSEQTNRSNLKPEKEPDKLIPAPATNKLTGISIAALSVVSSIAIAFFLIAFPRPVTSNCPSVNQEQVWNKLIKFVR